MRAARPDDSGPLGAGDTGATDHADARTDTRPDVTDGVTADGATADGAPGTAALLPLLADLRRRLGPACRDWSPDPFEALVREIALRKARWGDAGTRH